MESGSMAAPPAVGAGLGSAPGDKGLKTGALGFVSNVVIGVASTAPGYSLAATLGLVVGGDRHRPAGAGDPAVRLRPDAAHRHVLLLHEPRRSGLRHHLLVGDARRWARTRAGSAAGRSSSPTSSSWPTWPRSPASTASCSSAGRARRDSTTAVTIVGIVWIAIMTAICVYGIELSARTQVGLLGAELITLAIFAVVALVKVAAGDAGPDSVDPSLVVAQPVRGRQLERVRRRGAVVGLHLLGLGQHRHGQRGERELQRDARPGRRRQHLHPARRPTSSSPTPRRPSTAPRTSSITPTTSSARWATRSSARRWTSC